MEHQRHAQYIEEPLISKCELVLDEMAEKDVQKVRNTLFHIGGTSTNVGGSDIEKWFRRVTQGPTAVRSLWNNNRLESRLISWKTDKKFEAANLFFRTVDTSRLLPMALADFRIQWYAHKDIWHRLDTNEGDGEVGMREAWKTLALSGLMFSLLVMRNMQDYGGGDIPVVVTNWTSEELEIALDYWTELSKCELSKEERQNKFFEIDHRFGNAGPCFLQVDLLVRSLLSDPAVGYVPRSIVFISRHPNVKGRALFMDPTFNPPKALVDGFPTGCGNESCEDKDCGMFDFSACRSLASESKIVRRDKFPRNTVRCNVWTCEVVEPAGYTGPSLFQQCQRCKEALYCSKYHQIGDWNSHKRVCEAQRF